MWDVGSISSIGLIGFIGSIHFIRFKDYGSPLTAYCSPVLTLNLIATLRRVTNHGGEEKN
jgi:hypothetical protein